MGDAEAFRADVRRIIDGVDNPYFSHILDTGQYVGSPGASGARGTEDPSLNFYGSIEETAPLAVHVRCKIYRIQSGTEEQARATVNLMLDGVERSTTASGVGPVDAIFKGISDLVETESQLERYQVHAVTAGLDAQGEVSVTIRDAGRTVIGHGAHEDVLVASAKAYVHALNKLEWHRRRRAVEEPRGI